MLQNMHLSLFVSFEDLNFVKFSADWNVKKKLWTEISGILRLFLLSIDSIRYAVTFSCSFNNLLKDLTKHLKIC